MILDDVKYRKCECGISYPLAHCKTYPTNNEGKRRPDTYRKHNNKLCSPCIRAKMERLVANGSKEADALWIKMSKLLGGCNDTQSNT